MFDSAMYEKRDRQYRASRYRNSIYYGPADEKRICFHSCGCYGWTEKSSGVPWVAVSGTKSTCVMSMDVGDLDYPTGRIQLRNVAVMETALAAMDDMSIHFRQHLKILYGNAHHPFVVVSIPDGMFQGEEEALTRAFLESKLKNRSSLSTNEAAQIAVCALKYLFGPAFKSDKILTWCFGEGSVAPNGLMSPTLVKELLGEISHI